MIQDTKKALDSNNINNSIKARNTRMYRKQKKQTSQKAMDKQIDNS